MSKVLINFTTKLAHVLEDGKIYTKIPIVKSSATPVASISCRLPEGMLPKEMSAVEITKLIDSRYHIARHGEYHDRVIPDLLSRFNANLKGLTKGIRTEGVGGGTVWTYRKPSSIADDILSYSVLPTERVSMSVKAHPQIIEALDEYIARGIVSQGGKTIRIVKPPSAYYKSLFAEQFNGQTEPITMYFREPVSEAHLADLKVLTEQFKSSDKITDSLFLKGKLPEASWLSHLKENTPEDAYKTFKLALKYDEKLAEAVARVVKRGEKVTKHLHITEGLGTFGQIENFRYRISAGIQSAMDSVVSDYLRAMGVDTRGFVA